MVKRSRGRHAAGFDSNRLRRPVLVLSMTLLLAVSGVVVAAWLINGSGQGQAVAGQAQELTLTPGTPTDALYPGGTSSVATRVTNPNPFPVVITQFAQNGPITSDTAVCDTGGHEVSFATQAGEWEVAANDAADFVLADAAAMGLNSATACQGAVFTIPLTVTAASGTTGQPGTTTTTLAGGELGLVLTSARLEFGGTYAGIIIEGQVNPGPTELALFANLGGPCGEPIDGAGDWLIASVDPSGTFTLDGTNPQDPNGVADLFGLKDITLNLSFSLGTYQNGGPIGFEVPVATACSQPFSLTLSVIDSDGDGYADYEELLDGSDPNNPDSTPGPQPTTWWLDADSDGFGDPLNSVEAVLPPEGQVWASNGDDCNDSDSTINPGATDIPDDGIDQDCDGADADSTQIDTDSDGYPLSVDCDDTDPNINPGATDIPGDGIDQDCDGTDPDPAQVDADTDGYPLSDDCDDTDPAINPGATDIPGDGIDQNCVGGDNLQSDSDGDGVFADLEGFADPFDCDDTDPTIYPGATEIVDGIDRDCSGHPDSDGDGFFDDEEALLGTSPNNADTDADGRTDWNEFIEVGTDPLDPDTDNDGLTDWEEALDEQLPVVFPPERWNTDPLNPDTDGGGRLDGDEVFIDNTDPTNPFDDLPPPPP